jgi:hypothetical protein
MSANYTSRSMGKKVTTEAVGMTVLEAAQKEQGYLYRRFVTTKNWSHTAAAGSASLK